MAPLPMTPLQALRGLVRAAEKIDRVHAPTEIFAAMADAKRALQDADQGKGIIPSGLSVDWSLARRNDEVWVRAALVAMPEGMRSTATVRIYGEVVSVAPENLIAYIARPIAKDDLVQVRGSCAPTFRVLATTHQLAWLQDVTSEHTCEERLSNLDRIEPTRETVA